MTQARPAPPALAARGRARTAAVPRPQLLLGEPGRVVHRDEQRRAVEDVAVPRGRSPGAARADPSAPPRRRRGDHPCAARRRRARPSAAGRRRCCSRPAEPPVGRSAACRSTRRGTRTECAWKSSAEIADAHRHSTGCASSQCRARLNRRGSGDVEAQRQAGNRRPGRPGVGSGRHASSLRCRRCRQRPAALRERVGGSG